MPHTRHWSYTLNATAGEWALTPSLGPVGPRECGEPALGFRAMTYVRDTVRHPWLPRNATPGHPGLANIPHCPNQKQNKSQLVQVEPTSQMPLDIQNHVNLHRLLKNEAKTMRACTDQHPYTLPYASLLELPDTSLHPCSLSFPPQTACFLHCTSSSYESQRQPTQPQQDMQTPSPTNCSPIPHNASSFRSM